jgi:hypothetical protein
VASQRRSKRRTTTFPFEENNGPTSYNLGPSRQSAVARVLGTRMQQNIQSDVLQSKGQRSGRLRGIDVEVLLEGAEKLCAI